MGLDTVCYDNSGVLNTTLIMQNVDLDKLDFSEKYIVSNKELFVERLINEFEENNENLHNNIENIIIALYLKRFYEKDYKNKPFLASFKQASLLEAGLPFRIPYRIVKTKDKNGQYKIVYKLAKMNQLSEKMMQVLIKDFIKQNSDSENFYNVSEDLAKNFLFNSNNILDVEGNSLNLKF